MTNSSTTDEYLIADNQVNVNHFFLNLCIHAFLAISLAFRYFFSKSIQPFGYEIDFLNVINKEFLPIESFILKTGIPLHRIWPLLGFSLCLWLMISLFNGNHKKSWVYLLIVHAIPIMDIYGMIGAPWVGGTFLWVMALYLHCKPFKSYFVQVFLLLVLALTSFWVSSLSLYFIPWIAYSLTSRNAQVKYKVTFIFFIYCYVALYHLFHIKDIWGSSFSYDLVFIFKLWPIFLGPVALIITVGYSILWGLRSLFSNATIHHSTFDVGLLCLLLISTIFSPLNSINSSIEALIVLCLFIPFGLLAGKTTLIEKWSLNISYWTTTSIFLALLLAPNLKNILLDNHLNDDLKNFKSWHLNERASQDLSYRFWEVIKNDHPTLIICETKSIALQSEKYTDADCISLKEWEESLKNKITYDLSGVFLLVAKPLTVKERELWFGSERSWFLHKQWAFSIDKKKPTHYYLYGSLLNREVPLVF